MYIKILKCYFKKESGATAIEYGLIGGLLSILIITGLVVAGPEVEALFVEIGATLAGVN